MLGFLLICFLAGVLTVLAPCILPLLPVIIGGSIEGGAKFKKALVITISLCVSVLIFTLLLKVSTAFINIPPTVWQWLSGGIIIIFGLVTLFPGLWEHLSIAGKLNVSSNRWLAAGYKKKGLWGDIIIGASLGPVFSSCSPTYFIVLATVLPVAPLVGIGYLLAYVIGLGLALLTIALIGQKIVDHLGLAVDPRGWFKRLLGLLFIIVGLGVISGVDKQIEANLLSGGLFDITKVEQSLLKNTDSGSAAQVQGVPAPELVSPDGYLNTGGQPITLAQFKGKKVVLLDIWTYSCINCQRTLPYVKAWYDKYHDQGLEIIGIHTPEFAFEKVEANVADAIKRFDIKYPVILDNEYQTWNAYGNQYWPRKYLIDLNGNIVYDHIGEGNYEETEAAIQKALGITGATSQVEAVTVDPAQLGSPETYFGADRGAGSTQYLDGKWTITNEYVQNVEAGGKIIYRYQAKNVYLVAGASQPTDVEVYQDGTLVKVVTVKEQKLYQVIGDSTYGKHTLELKVKSPGLEVYTFTFG